MGWDSERLSNLPRVTKLIKVAEPGLPWWSSGYDSSLPRQGARVPSLVRELDPTCRN